MRGYELADKLDVEYGQLKEQAEEEGLELGHHMSDVEEDVAERLIEIFGNGSTEDGQAVSDTESSTTTEEQQEPDVKEKEGVDSGEEEGREQSEEEAAGGDEDRQKRMRKADLKRKKDDQGTSSETTTTTETPAPDDAGEEKVELSLPLTVRDVSEELGIPSNELIMQLMQEGVRKTINDQLDQEDLDALASSVDQKIRVVEEKELEEEVLDEIEEEEADPDELEPRAPVVTILGHVDHGKTSILDRIRETQIAEGEAGGITQKVGASRIKHDDGEIIFLDTPGHEAFTSMRARGANATDLVVLVVAADDGVMPQTKESVSHARAADVPIVVAINKIDKPNADVTRTRQQVSELDLIPEDWGGETVFVNTSAETGEGIDELLEMILLESELMDLAANPDKDARGVCIESKIDEYQGVTTTLLVQEGTLTTGDVVLCGATYGRIKALFDDRQNNIDEAGPSDPTVVLGLNDPPEAGEPFYVVEDEQTAQEIVEDRQEKNREKELKAQSQEQKAKLANILDGESEEEKFVDIVLKAGSHGSVEVLVNSLQDMQRENASVNLLHHGVGDISESDVVLAEASNAIVLGFQTGVDSRARKMAERKDIEIRTYDVIYNLLEEMEKALLGVLEPEQVREKIGQLTVKEVFDITGVGTVAGCYVADGRITRDAIVQVYRDEEMVHEGEVSSLKRFQEDRSEVKEGYECGVSLKNFSDVKVGDILQAFTEEEVLKTVENTG